MGLHCHTDESETLNLFCGFIWDFLFVDFNGSELVMGGCNEANKRIFSQSYSHSNYIFYHQLISLSASYARA